MRSFFCPPLQVRLGGDVTNTQLKQLIPETEYSISLRAVFEEAVSDPLEGKGLTRTSALVGPKNPETLKNPQRSQIKLFMVERVIQPSG